MSEGIRYHSGVEPLVARVRAAIDALPAASREGHVAALELLAQLAADLPLTDRARR